MTNPTKEQRRRLIVALHETMDLLAREQSYLPQHQKADRIAFYKAHIAKLDGMLAGWEPLPVVWTDGRAA